MGKNNSKYNIGLDIGTSSVGWCVTDSHNKILKFNNKKMWGVRLFEEAASAAETRVKRGQRRRYMRRHQRIRLLQELVGEMVSSVDKNFFIRLQDSFFFKEDKRVQAEYTLFADKDYTDSDYYKEFPSIYHLRKYLMSTEEKADPRKIYLALHHIIKYRGHFLYEGQELNRTDEGMEASILALGDLLIESSEEREGISIEPKGIYEVLCNNTIRNKEKQDELAKRFICQGLDKKLATEIAKAIIGYKFDVSIIVNDEMILDDTGKAMKVQFADAKYEEQAEKIEEVLQERFSLIAQLQKIYSQYVLNTILNGKSYISEAMLERYEKHHRELKMLKALVRKYNPSQYTVFFRLEKGKDKKVIKNYVNYIKGDKACNQEDFYKAIKQLLKEAPKEDINYQECLKEMEEGKFLPKLNSRENSSIPYQVNKIELEKIIDNQSRFYPILKEQKEKIISLLTFRIPYYVGPLNPKTSPRFAWIKRTEEKLYPWNFDDVIKVDETAEGFITRMTSYCTYLPDKKVIPKHSLLYSRYCVLNELANIRVNDKKLEPKDKLKIINDLFMHYRKITNKKLCDWLEREQWGGNSVFHITGYQKENEFASSLGTYIDFYRIFGKVDNTNEEMIEEIIYWLTVFEEKTIVKKKILNKYKEQVSKEQLKKILLLRYKGWSRLSKELLLDLHIKKDEQPYNIMYYLENTKMNFMQIINDKELGFYQLIRGEQEDLSGDKITIKDIQRLQGSPQIKRGIWQTIKIIDEIQKCMGCPPANIMIEMARSDEESKRTQSRQKRLLEAYAKLEEEIGEYNKKVVQELKDKKYISQLNNESVFLYFIQNGKSLYSQKELNLEQLSTTCQVDHIVPRCYIKDDSIENKALVLVGENQDKLDKLVLDKEIQNKNRTWWSILYKHGLIGTKKYHNLLRESLSENEQKGFINRQLVETRQICKHVAVLLQGSYVNSNIITIKAEISSLFRQKYNLYKNRNINDLHHAQDAYLSTIIGNTLLLNNECDNAEWIYSEYRKDFKNHKISKNEKHGYILSMFDRDIVDSDGVLVWKKQHSLEEVLKVFNYKNCLITKKLEEGTGQFYDETIYGREENKELIPLKEGLDVKKYGGYSGVKNAYSVAISYQNKKKIEKRLIGVPVKVAYDIKKGKLTLEDYLSQKGYQNVQILRRKILKYQLIEQGNDKLFITSYKEACNAKQLMLDKEAQKIIYWISNRKYQEIENDVETLNHTYYKLIEKVKEYYGVYKNVWTQIEEKITYDKLSIEDKCKLIEEILKLTKANAQNANLKLFNTKLAERVGRIKNDAGMKIEETIFIDQSVTGLFERRQTI